MTSLIGASRCMVAIEMLGRFSALSPEMGKWTGDQAKTQSERVGHPQCKPRKGCV